VDVDQNANTIQGTIGKGASGVGEEAQRAKERLQAPDYLNEKEKMIFEKLDGALEPTKLEVCHMSLSGGGGGKGADIGCGSSAVWRSDLRLDALTTIFTYRFKTFLVDAVPCTGSRL
jgi:hypothetical protein